MIIYHRVDLPSTGWKVPTFHLVIGGTQHPRCHVIAGREWEDQIARGRIRKPNAFAVRMFRESKGNNPVTGVAAWLIHRRDAYFSTPPLSLTLPPAVRGYDRSDEE
ncbi:hypothetical protein [Nocardiopsis rhodophaea]|uniref:hypothetical protein n=1 Tax=Nocardiopsis rhodophaea TaxID=280238 RepID=UPI0031E257C7